ncbi:MAG: hypothetical protein IPL61_00110 [Myxococcales bacterium]|nr:hypothetical protein [Myxococcales bacterium]
MALRSDRARPLAALLVALAACSGKTSPTTPGPTPGSGADPGSGSGSAVVDVTPPAPPPRLNRAPEVFAPGWKSVGVNQTIAFSVAAIDQDLDDVKVEVMSMPASATFDPITLTVVWRPTKMDLPKANFTLAITELTGPGAGQPPLSVSWDIAVTPKKQPVPTAPWAGDVAETLLTIREPARVEATAKAFPFDELLAWTATSMRAPLAPEAAAKLPPPDKALLFKQFLKNLAVTHSNPRLDPDAPGFDAATFGDPRDWKLVVIRPRLDKKFHELRLVYQAVKAPEPVFAMFRVRPVEDLPTLPPEAKAENNKVSAELLWKHLLTADGAVNPKWKKDPKAHGQAVLAFVRGMLGYQGAAPWARSGFIALATEARLGGGTARNPDGSYQSGDGWAWSVQKPMIAADGATQSYVNIGIPGFWTHVVPSADQSAWIGKCAPTFDPDDKGHKPGYEALCRKALGFVDLPDLTGKKPAPAKLDAVNLYRDHKLGPSVALLPVDDGRRDHGEENGMTCAQCHIRNFGVRDYADAATADPKAGTPAAANHPIATLNFQIVPSHRWEAYTLEFMADQECKIKAFLAAELGKESKLACPLADPSAPRIARPLPE